MPWLYVLIFFSKVPVTLLFNFFLITEEKCCDPDDDFIEGKAI